jgi:hypothetical protein
VCAVALAASAIDVVSAAAQSIEPCALSRDIQVVPEIRPLVEHMFTSSATFHAQYCRIAEAPNLVVGVLLDPTLPAEHLRSRTAVRRYDSGLMVAEVAVCPGTRTEEWIAHEFEHILEQLEGVNLPKLATVNASSVWYSGSAMFETSRAVAAGRTVYEELQHVRTAAGSLAGE